MGCCGQKRAKMRNAPQTEPSETKPPLAPATTPPTASAAAPAAFAVRPTPTQASSPAVSTRIRYVEVSPILVRGPATGRRYSFSGANPVQAVDARDAERLLRTRFFRIAL